MGPVPDFILFMIFLCVLALIGTIFMVIAFPISLAWVLMYMILVLFE